MHGSPTKSNDFNASLIFFTIFAFAEDKPILSIDFLNKLLSSAFLIDSGLAPIISIFSFSKIPSLCNSNVTFSAVCPPIVGKIASGFSFFIIL